MGNYKRVLIKLSGDALSGDLGYGLDSAQINRFGEEIRTAVDLGIQIGVVVGGGNILRGAEQAAEGMDRVSSDHMGMLATVINGLSIKQHLDKIGIPTQVMSSISMQGVCEPFSRNAAVDFLNKGKVVVFVGGTGNPFFTTDSAAALRAIEIEADALLKATKVDGIYDKDPKKFNDAKKFETITYTEVFEKNLRVMDLAAIALSSDNSLPIQVFNFTEPEHLKRILSGEVLGTLVGAKDA